MFPCARILIGSPPLARGKERRKENELSRVGITPACAGKSLWWNGAISMNRDHPRLRGEKKAGFLKGSRKWGSPPLARGKEAHSELRSVFPRITPACAGKSLPLLKIFVRYRDHPRLRGEKLPLSEIKSCQKGSPPLARGKGIVGQI